MEDQPDHQHQYGDDHSKEHSSIIEKQVDHTSAMKSFDIGNGDKAKQVEQYMNPQAHQEYPKDSCIPNNGISLQ